MGDLQLGEELAILNIQVVLSCADNTQTTHSMYTQSTVVHCQDEGSNAMQMDGHSRLVNATHMDT